MNEIENDISLNNKKLFSLKKLSVRVLQKGGVYIALLFLLIISGIISPKTVEPTQLLEVLRNTSILGIISIGQTLLILTGGIDLSVGAHITLTNLLIAGITLGQQERTFLAIVISLTVGVMIGLVNGLLAIKLKIEPLIGSLGVMTLIIGIGYIYTKGFAKGHSTLFVRFLGIGRIFGFLPVAIVLWTIIAIIIIFILRRTIFGRYIYACGANPQAAYITGIKIDRVRLSIYVISGLLTAIAGLIWSGFLGTPTLTGGEYFPLDSVAAVIIGGTTFAGGKGGIGGTIVGAIIMVYLSSLLTILGLGYAGKIMVQGLIILLLVFSYTGRKKYK